MEREKEKKLEEEKEMLDFEAQAAIASCSSPLRAESSHSLSYNDHECTNQNVSDVSSCSSISSKLQVSSSDSYCQTPLHLSNNTPRKLNLYNKLHAKNKEIKDMKKQINAMTQHLAQVNNVEQLLNLSNQFLPPSLCLIINTHINRRNTKETGYRYSNEFKQLALTIYFLGPKVYKFLQSTLALPNPCTLKRITKRYEISPGLNLFLFNFLQFKTQNFLPESLECVLCADEMSIKSNLYYNISKDEIIGFNESNNRKTYDPAKFVLVLMIRGINCNWKQPIAYFFISNSCTGFDLQDIIFSSIFKLQNIKINVKAFISDMGSNFIGLSNKLQVSPERPYFEVNNHKIVYIFDPPHLLKATRNMFYQHNFMFNNELIEKKHLVSFFNEDSKNNLRTAPKLTYSHIFPGPFEKMRVYLAAQVFSESVMSAMLVYLESSRLPDTSLPTINFIKNMDKLFDIFNSTRRPGLKNFNRPFKNTDAQMSHLKFMENFFKQLQVFDKKTHVEVTRRMKFIRGWLISISGIFQLWESLKVTNTDDSYVLYTNRINQDCLENLFGTFRTQHNGNNINPTPIQFVWSFKQNFCSNYFRHSDNANCIADLDEILSKMNTDPINNENIKIIFPNKNPFSFKKNTITVDTPDYRNLSLPEKNAFIYVCGFLMKKCIEKHTCSICIDYAKTQKKIDESFLLCYFKAYENAEKSTFGNLMMPQHAFYEYINELENIFISRFPQVAIEKEVGIKLKLSMTNIVYNHPCPLFNKEYLINYFIRFRIHAAIKFLNRNLISEKIKKNRKLSILNHL